MTPRLPDSETGLITHGKRSVDGEGARVRVDARGDEPGDGQPRVAQAFARLLLVARDDRGAGRVTGQTQPLGDARGNHRRPIADRDEAVEGRRPGGLDDRLDRRVFVVKPDRDRAVPPGILEHVTAIGGKDQRHAEALGGLAKRTRLIPGRRREQQHAWHQRCVMQLSHTSITSSGLGSAQQYQGSLRYGTRVRSRRRGRRRRERAGGRRARGPGR